MFCALLKSFLGTSKVSDRDKLTTSSKRQSIHQFTVKTLSGADFDFSNLKGKKIMVVNTASKCGLTPQYKKLQELYEKYHNHNFEIVGFPSNNFMFQEPGNNQDIANFCEKNYGVTFPMMSKVDVKGKKQAKIYQFLTKKIYNGTVSSSVKWNFQKFLIDENGYVVKSVAPKTDPLDSSITNWIENKN